jgi:mannose-6-phosphate isomerase-like protein (cupin superfamily)
MKTVRKNDSEEFRNGDACTVSEYHLGDPDINGAVIRLSGRYPTSGRAVNLVCKELAYVIDGSGRLVVDGVEETLQEGDLVCIDAGEKYFWDGAMTLFVPCVPAWTPEQHRMVED